PAALQTAGLYFSQSVIWVKEHPVLTRKDMIDQSLRARFRKQARQVLRREAGIKISTSTFGQPRTCPKQGKRSTNARTNPLWFRPGVFVCSAKSNITRWCSPTIGTVRA